MYVTFEESINAQNKDYLECINAQNPKYLRSMPPGCTPKSFIDFLKQLYEKNNLLKVKQKKSNHIPKIIHQIWFGPNKPPPEYQNFQESWGIKHPEWQWILWNEQKIKNNFSTNLYNQTLFERAKYNKNYAKMADIARYEILYKFGGLYADCDCESIKPFDILNESYDFYSGIEHLANGLVIGNALIGSQPKHPIIKKCLNNIKEYENKKIDLTYWQGKLDCPKGFEKEYATTLITTGPILLTKSIWEIADKTKNIDIIFPPTYFFPFAEYKKEPIKPETFSCHYFNGLWKKL
jgi:mannosyltransferase OCH1-like enzyme